MIELSYGPLGSACHNDISIFGAYDQGGGRYMIDVFLPLDGEEPASVHIGKAGESSKDRVYTREERLLLDELTEICKTQRLWINEIRRRFPMEEILRGSCILDTEISPQWDRYQCSWKKHLRLGIEAQPCILLVEIATGKEGAEPYHISCSVICQMKAFEEKEISEVGGPISKKEEVVEYVETALTLARGRV